MPRRGGSVPGKGAAWGRKPLSDVYFSFLRLALGLFSVAGWLKVGQRGLMSCSTSN